MGGFELHLSESQRENPPGQVLSFSLLPNQLCEKCGFYIILIIITSEYSLIALDEGNLSNYDVNFLLDQTPSIFIYFWLLKTNR